MSKKSVQWALLAERLMISHLHTNVQLLVIVDILGLKHKNKNMDIYQKQETK